LVVSQRRSSARIDHFRESDSRGMRSAWAGRTRVRGAGGGRSRGCIEVETGRAIGVIVVSGIGPDGECLGEGR